MKGLAWRKNFARHRFGYEYLSIMASLLGRDLSRCECLTANTIPTVALACQGVSYGAAIQPEVVLFAIRTFDAGSAHAEIGTNKQCQT